MVVAEGKTSVALELSVLLQLCPGLGWEFCRGTAGFKVHGMA